MKKTILFLMAFAFLLVSPCAAQGEKVNVVGFVADSLSGEPEAYATLRIFPKGDMKNAAAMLVSDDEGKFTAVLPRRGDYVLLVTSVGRKSLERRFKADSPKVDLGTLFISDDVKMLGEVAVVAKKPLVKVDMDKIAYSVEDDPDAETKSVLDMLRKVPMVSVDGEGNISLSGKQGFKIYVNGKPNSMMSNNPKEVLRSMPANSIKNIEVITNPGAKYDAEGVGGIINIITTGSAVEGYSLTLDGGYSRHNSYNASASLLTQIKKFTFSTQYGYSVYNMPNNVAEMDLLYKESPQLAHVYSKYDDFDFKQRGHNFSVNASYEVDSLNLFSLGGTFYKFPQSQNSHGAYWAWDAAGDGVYGYKFAFDNTSEYNSGNLSVDYQHMSPKRKGEMLIVSYRMDRGPQASESYQTISDAWGSYENQKLYLATDAVSFENTLQADYTIPFRRLHSLNFGAKYIHRRNDSENTNRKFDEASGAWVDSGVVGAGDNRHRQHVFGVYSEYDLRYKTFGLRAGLRYEYTKQHVRLDNYAAADFSPEFSDVVPSLLLSYGIGAAQNVTLGYNMRIRRPGIWYLNPFRDASTSPLYLNYGNPDLKTEHYHSLTAGYGIYTVNFSAGLNVEYSFTNDAIMEYSFLDGNSVINNTYENLGENKSAVANFYLNWNPSGKTRINVNGMAGFHKLANSDGKNEYGLRGIGNDGWSFNINGGLSQNLPWKLLLNAYAGAGRSQPRIYTVQRPFYYYYGLSLQRSFLKEDRLSVTFSASNFAQKEMQYKTIDETPDYKITSINMNLAAQWSVSVSYRFGNFNASVKKVRKSIQNTDVVGGTGKS